MLDTTYRVHILPGALDAVGGVARVAVRAHRYAIVTDSNVGPLYGERVREALSGQAADLFTIPAGERHKTRETWAAVTDRMLDAGFGRDCAVIALGGGVVGDLAGFVAATFMRGVPVIHVPTSLLAMLDASIGGKTAVDTPAGKNLVGAFHQPAAVITDPGVLATLPVEQYRAGITEALKHGVIAEAAHFDAVAATAAGIDRHRPDARAISAIIARSVEIKSAVAYGDYRESGRRKTLNFGHTIGHAIEHLSGYALLHGEAVAIGMCVEAEIAERVGVARAGTADRIRAACAAAGLPDRRPMDLAAEAIVAATHGDKKGRAGRAEYALPAAIGGMAFGDRGWAAPVDDAVVLAALA
ncbi:MAG: 3-dehydroquinate synthase [Gemmatimonadota bacterium]|nr:3-dehydroquinate synthase [Gemmatimonadota bacterium]MDE3128982.1 3-dehydroquinate synthase [Gemmatimonadota bacterium]MDE3173237.1 3-dehydroquinate synthase [Gemmatimonadota bacterium]MDE3214859.1 3-dehydroquinate synthase [Gemmatimonadota bacterium]